MLAFEAALTATIPLFPVTAVWLHLVPLKCAAYGVSVGCWAPSCRVSPSAHTSDLPNTRTALIWRILPAAGFAPGRWPTLQRLPFSRRYALPSRLPKIQTFE